MASTINITDDGSILYVDEMDSVDIEITIKNDDEEIGYSQLIDPKFCLMAEGFDPIIDFGDREVTSLTIKLGGKDTAICSDIDTLERWIIFRYSYVDSDGDTRVGSTEGKFYIKRHHA